MKLCGWFWAMDGTSRAVFLTRFSWLASFLITFLGLLPTGWQLVKVRPAPPPSAESLHGAIHALHTRLTRLHPSTLSILNQHHPAALLNHTISNQYNAADQSVSARYGLWKIEYAGTTNFVSDYLQWSAAQPDGSSAYTRVQGARACVVMGLAVGAAQFLTALRLWCAKDGRVQRRLTVMCTMLAALDFVFAGLALLVWKVRVIDTAGW